MWALVIILLAGSDGGRAINTDLRFDTAARCERAAEQVRSVQRTGWVPAAVCVEVNR